MGRSSISFISLDLEEARRLRDNEEKLAAIELSFPDDDLQLLVRGGPPVAGAEDRPKTGRRLSAPSALFKFVTQVSKMGF